MHGPTKLALVIAMLGGTIAAAQANVSAAAASTDGAIRYDAHQPCHYYVNRDLPGPKRCTRFFSNALGPDVYVRYGFVFRNRDSFVQFRNLGWFKEQVHAASRKEQAQLAARKTREAEVTLRKEQARLAAKEERARLATQEIRERNEMRQRQVRLAREELRAARMKEAVRHERSPEEGKQLRLAAKEDHHPLSGQKSVQEKEIAKSRKQVRLASTENKKHIGEVARHSEREKMVAGDRLAAKDKVEGLQQKKSGSEDQVRVAAAEDHNPAAEKDRIEEQDGPRSKADADSGWNDDSDTASHADTADDGDSGGAGHGEDADEGRSGGASGY